MSETIAVVAEKIAKIEEEIKESKAALKTGELTDGDKRYHQNLVLESTKRLAGLEAERRELRQQQQASAGKFSLFRVFVYKSLQK